MKEDLHAAIEKGRTDRFIEFSLLLFFRFLLTDLDNVFTNQLNSYATERKKPVAPVPNISLPKSFLCLQCTFLVRLCYKILKANFWHKCPSFPHCSPVIKPQSQPLICLDEWTLWRLCVVFWCKSQVGITQHDPRDPSCSGFLCSMHD